MEENIKISVVVTAYNKQDSIIKCVESILNSTYKNLEIIIVEDKSTDNTLKVIKDNLLKDSRVKLVEHTINKGAGLSRRDGIKTATGEFVSLIDGDDYISKDFIESLVTRQKETQADIVSGGITNINEDGSTDIKLFQEKVSEGNQKLLDYGKGTIIFLNNKIVRRSLYDIVEYSDKRYCEDTPVIIPLLYHANKVAYVSNAGYYYYHSQNSLTGKVSMIKHNIACADCMVFLRNYFKNIPDAKFYLEMLSFNQFIGYLYTAVMQDIKPEDLKECLPEYINSVKYLLTNIVGPNANENSGKTNN